MSFGYNKWLIKKGFTQNKQLATWLHYNIKSNFFLGAKVNAVPLLVFSFFFSLFLSLLQKSVTMFTLFRSNQGKFFFHFKKYSGDLNLYCILIPNYFVRFLNGIWLLTQSPSDLLSTIQILNVFGIQTKHAQIRKWNLNSKTQTWRTWYKQTEMKVWVHNSNCLFELKTNTGLPVIFSS